MSLRRQNPKLLALLPWLGAAALWLGVVTPMRTQQADRLEEQGRVRRDRLKSERASRDTESLRTRIEATLHLACRASPEPAAVRQRAVASTAGLALSPFTLSVTGGAAAGAVVEAEGSRSAALELLGRLGDPARGGFLRSAALRDKGHRFGISATTGVLELAPGNLLPAASNCESMREDPLPEPSPEPTAPPVRTRATPFPPAKQPEFVPTLPTPEPTPAPPFTLIGFLISEGKNRISLRVGGQVRVVAAGDTVAGWRCLSVDRDEGAVFVSGAGERLVLKAGAGR